MVTNRYSFRVIPSNKNIPTGANACTAFLKQDRWDKYGWSEYRTQFILTVIDNNKRMVEIGYVKIGVRGLKPGDSNKKGYRTPDIPDSFVELDKEYFSLGQSAEYYEKLKILDNIERRDLLTALGDVAYDSARWEWAKNEQVMRESLMLNIAKSIVEGSFRRLAHGNAKVTPFRFTYTPPKRLGDGKPPFKLYFDVDPVSPIPTNLHVLIGRNGVGKTYILSLMAKALAGKDAAASQSGSFEFLEDYDESSKFTNVVAVSYSAFDHGGLMPNSSRESHKPAFSFIGLRRNSKEDSKATGNPKSPDALAKEFSESMKVCRMGRRKKIWIEVIQILQSDPVFSSAKLLSLVEHQENNSGAIEEASSAFKQLSAGHKVVLLAITRLVEMTQERTLVLMDEPEGHLHPPLLSAMARAISELMVKTNGVAIIATHSPVVLQEVPQSCVWILNRIGRVSSAERPAIETFGENVGVLTREVFQLELSQSGFHNLLNKIADQERNYDSAVKRIGMSLGSEGRSLLRAMYLIKDNRD